MMSVNTITKIMEHFKVMLELHRKIRGTLGNKEVLAMMEMNGKEANNSPFQKKPKAM